MLRRIYRFVKYRVLGFSAPLSNPKAKYLTYDPTATVLFGNIQNYQYDPSKIVIGAHAQMYGRIIVFAQGGYVQMGEYSLLGENSYITSMEKVIIGNRVLISWNVSIFDSNSHPISPEQRHIHFKNLATEGLDIPTAATIIEDDVWIGCNSIILKGVTIGKGAIVAAGSVVTKSIPPFTMVAGNPARIVKQLEV